MAPMPDVSNLTMLIKSMTNVQMKNILRSEGLAVSGVKLSLQLRLIEYIERLHQRGSLDKYDHVARTIYSKVGVPYPSDSTVSTTATTTYPSQTAAYAPSKSAASRDTYTSKMPSQPFSSGRLMFKDSPFYRILEQLSPTVECKVREQTRDHVEMKVVLSTTTAQKLQEDSNLRVMVFCAADMGLNQFAKSDIAFPQQVELKVNLDDIKANLRGLKNRPGSTRPADITRFIRKRPGYTNIVDMTFALTQKKFYVVVNLVKLYPVADLVARLKSRNKITKQQVLREMRNRAHDADIVATSTVMSLKCPLSTLRIQIPCRSLSCTHNQCFDAASFLELQQQGPTWTCPVCNKSASFESLQIDEYVEDILHTTSSSVEQVTIEPNGTWHADKREDPARSSQADSNFDEDIVEIEDPFTPNLKRETTSEPRTLLLATPTTNTTNTTPFTQNGSNRATPNLSRSSLKRPAPQVVDLTLSDDDEDDDSSGDEEDDEGETDLPVRPAKRQALEGTVSRRDTYGNSSSFTNGYSQIEDLRSPPVQSSLSLSPSRPQNFYTDLS